MACLSGCPWHSRLAYLWVLTAPPQPSLGFWGLLSCPGKTVSCTLVKSTPSLSVLSALRRRATWSWHSSDAFVVPGTPSLTVPLGPGSQARNASRLLRDAQESANVRNPGQSILLAREAAKTETKDREPGVQVGSPSESGWGQGLAGSPPRPTWSVLLVT